MVKLNPYLNFDGTCEEAFNFYKSVFGGEFQGGIMKMKDLGEKEQEEMGGLSEQDRELVMHVSLPIGNEVLMGSDVMSGQRSGFRAGNNNYISVMADSRQEADRLFDALSVDGEVEMPMEDMFWGDYYGSFVDRYGTGWMIFYSEVQT